MSKVSVIITTFNREKHIGCAVESVLNQSYKDFELLILDNSSTDNTRKIVEGIKDSRIRYIIHPAMSISSARNLGVRESKGEFIAFLDDDDEWLPAKIEKQLKVFNNKDTALVYGGFEKIDSDGKNIGNHRPVLKGKILNDLLSLKDDFTASASNPMLRKSVIIELGLYNEKVLTGEDYELYLRIAKKYLIDYTPEIVLKIKTHYGSRLGDRLKDAAELELMLLDDYCEIFDNDGRLKSFYLQRIGGKYIRIGENKLGRSYIIKSIRSYSLNLIAYAQYLVSFLNIKVYRFLHDKYLKIQRKLRS
ncbi:MAG: hypothetical protein A2231_02375 [Candidatus Firestonebacteria bacterium RIFOXYA2_FULL_40_8]|nr:MAG: hypothetical protein A2231_02375 [Candidatus Firestonebacteria bacterium RIFOXYA2_FULL_40_8]